MRTIGARGIAVVLAIGVLGAVAVRAQQSAATAPPSDLTGDWRLDPAHSDAPPLGGGERGGGGGYGGGHGGHGGYGGHGGGWGGGHHSVPDGTSTNSGGGGRGARLPALFHITQTPTLVSFEDSSGVVLQEIATVAAAADTMMRAPGALHVAGTWDGATLAIAREGPRGNVKETWKLGPSGQTLDQVVAFESQEMGSRTMRRVYRRVDAP